MKASEISVGGWLQIVANIGILGGLALVGLQMKQNSDLLRSELIYTESDRQLQFENSMLGENPAAVWAKLLDDPLGLTLEETRIAEAIFYHPTEQFWAAYRLYELGLINEEDWKHRINRDAQYFFLNPVGRAWWDSIKSILQPEVIEYVEFIIENGPENFNLDTTQEFYSNVRNRIRENIENQN